MTLILAWRNYFYSAHIVRQLASFLALAIRNRTWWCEAGAASFCSRNVCFLGVDVCVIGRWQQNSSNRLAVSCEPLQLCYCRARKRIIHNSGPAIWYNLMLLLRLHDFCCTYTGMIETVCQKSSYPSSKRGTHAGSVRRLEPKDPVASRSGRDIIVTEINPTVAFCRYNLDGCLVFFKRQKIYFERELIPFFFHPWFCVGDQGPYITVKFLYDSVCDAFHCPTGELTCSSAQTAGWWLNLFALCNGGVKGRIGIRFDRSIRWSLIRFSDMLFAWSMFENTRYRFGSEYGWVRQRAKRILAHIAYTLLWRVSSWLCTSWQKSHGSMVTVCDRICLLDCYELCQKR